jgi:hypothetical protein
MDNGNSLNIEPATFNPHSFAWCAARPVLFRFSIQKKKEVEKEDKGLKFISARFQS